MKKKLSYLCVSIFLLLGIYQVIDAQTNTASSSVKEIKQQKQEADKEIKQTQAQLGANEKKVTETLASLRKIDEDIEVSSKEIETVQGQLTMLKDTIKGLETEIEGHENDLTFLRDEYLKSVKKMRVARKRNSGMVFLFASKSFGEAKRRLRYLQEFSDWKNRRSEEISNKVEVLHDRRQQVVQAREDVAVALSRQKKAQDNLTLQRNKQQITVDELRANSEVLKSKLARRQAEARALGNQISQLIAEQQAKEAREAEARKKAEEEKRLAEERAAAEKRAAEERELAAERKAAQERQLAAAERKIAQERQPATTEKKIAEKKVAETSAPDKSEYATARRRRSRSTTETPSPSPTPSQNVSTGDFGGMKGSLPRPVSGSFKIVSPFGVHPISPELPDILDENLGIDAHVANGASACAVFDGEVIKIYDRSTTTGFRNIIVVKHGDYITVYANLETLAVKTGQRVSQGQRLGTVGADFDNPSYGKIHFEVWKNQTRLDPATWIKN